MLRRRRHLVELSDEDWFPDVLRTAMMAYLRFVAELFGHGRRIAPVLARALEAAPGTDHVLDLGSGAGGPTIPAFRALHAQRPGLSLTLSDLHPDTAALEEAARLLPGAIRVSPLPVDARRVPASLVGVRTLMNVLHHFRPPDVRSILQDAVGAGQPIVVVEMLRRHPAIVLANLGAGAGVLLALPFLRPFRWSWLLWTYLLPAIPLLFSWDATVSTLRVYSEGELRGIIGSLEGHDSYEWRFEELWLAPAPVPGMALVGTPRRG